MNNECMECKATFNTPDNDPDKNYAAAEAHVHATHHAVVGHNLAGWATQ